MRDIWVKDNKAYSLLRRSEIADGIGYTIYPGLLDSCLQTLCSLPELFDSDDVTDETMQYIPFMIKRLVMYGVVNTDRLWCLTEDVKTHGEGGMLSANITLMAEDGRVIIHIEGLTVRRLLGRVNSSTHKRPLRESEVSSKPSVEHVGHFKGMDEGQIRSALNAIVIEEVRKTLAVHKAKEISTGQNLFDYGMDSLMAVELKNRLEKRVNMHLRSTMTFDFPTIEKMTAYIESLLRKPAEQVIDAERQGIDARLEVDSSTYNKGGDTIDDAIERELSGLEDLLREI